jgi:hypothetical protein
MTQRMDGGRGLSNRVASHALIFVCRAFVPRVDEMPSADILPGPG